MSKEEDVEKGHDIVPDGYNIGRCVPFARLGFDPEPGLSPSSRRDQLVAHAVGLKSWGSVNYYTVAQNITGLMRAGSEGVNHGKAFSLVIHSLATNLALCNRHCRGRDRHPPDCLRDREIGLIFSRLAKLAFMNDNDSPFIPTGLYFHVCLHSS